MKKLLQFLYRNNASFQSCIFWIVAVINIQTDRFWFFASMGAILGSMQMLIDEIRSKKDNTNSEQ